MVISFCQSRQPAHPASAKGYGFEAAPGREPVFAVTGVAVGGPMAGPPSITDAMYLPHNWNIRDFSVNMKDRSTRPQVSWQLEREKDTKQL